MANMIPLEATLNASLVFVLWFWLRRLCSSKVFNGRSCPYNSAYRATNLAVVPNTMILESPWLALISALRRVNKAGKMSSAFWITTENWGTPLMVGGSDSSSVDIDV